MQAVFDLSVPIPLLLARLGCAVALGAAIAWRPMSRRALAVPVKHALLILTIASAVVSLVVKDSPGLALAVFGLGSFIRFRTAIKDPRDVVLFFVAIGAGLACGLGMVPVAAVGVSIIWAILVALDWKPAPPAEPVVARPPAPARELAGIRE